jgi:hypothetical protein
MLTALGGLAEFERELIRTAREINGVASCKSQAQQAVISSSRTDGNATFKSSAKVVKTTDNPRNVGLDELFPSVN